MILCPISTTFETRACEIGWGQHCISALGVRADSYSPDQKIFYGVGCSSSPWEARLSAEGEAIERATFELGHAWSDAHLAQSSTILPDEASLLMSTSEKRYLTRPYTPSITATNLSGGYTTIPLAAVFNVIEDQTVMAGASLSTGWAYFPDSLNAIRRSYYEVIERDLNMVFWFNRGAEILEHADISEISSVCHDICLSVQRTFPDVYVAEVKIPDQMGSKAFYALAIYSSVSKPYLSVTAAVRQSRALAIRAAYRELVMLRVDQHENIISGRKIASDGYTAHVDRTNHDISMCDHVLWICERVKSQPHIKKLIVDYRNFETMFASFPPPPSILTGVVTKVWINGCQPMPPASVPCSALPSWCERWDISEHDWSNNRWHPFP